MTTFSPDGSDDDYNNSNGRMPHVGYKAYQEGRYSAASGQPLPASLLSIFLALLPSLLLKL